MRCRGRYAVRRRGVLSSLLHRVVRSHRVVRLEVGAARDRGRRIRAGAHQVSGVAGPPRPRRGRHADDGAVCRSTSPACSSNGFAPTRRERGLEERLGGGSMIEVDPLVIGYAGALALFVLLALGIPVGVSMGVIGVVGMVLGAGEALTFGQLRTLPFAVVNNYAFAVLPMFVLMGVLAEAAGLTSQVFHAADLWLRRFRGGLYQAVIVGLRAVRGDLRIHHRQRGGVHPHRVPRDDALRLLEEPVHRLNRGGGELRGDDSAVDHDGHLRDHDRAVGGAAPDRGSDSRCTPDRGRLPGRRLCPGAPEPLARTPDQRAGVAARTLARRGRGVADRGADGAGARRNLHRDCSRPRRRARPARSARSASRWRASAGCGDGWCRRCRTRRR